MIRGEFSTVKQVHFPPQNTVKQVHHTSSKTIVKQQVVRATTTVDKPARNRTGKRISKEGRLTLLLPLLPLQRRLGEKVGKSGVLDTINDVLSRDAYQ